MNYELREFQGIHELALLPDLERQIWGADGLVMPPELLRAIQDEGGLIAGAFTPDQHLVAFVFGLPTKYANVQHSHALGVLEAHRSAGLGAQLKWWQRNWCLERGIEKVRWTFDPLRLANAKLNILKLGATSHLYFENYYGDMTGINAGTPSDRIMAEWDLLAPNVLLRLEEKTIVIPPEAKKIPIPHNFTQLPQSEALQWRMEIRGALQAHFASGYQITNFILEPEPAYLLEKIMD